MPSSTATQTINSFSLSSSLASYTLFLNGSVQNDLEETIGNWSTSPDNNLLLELSDETTDTILVDWQFNEDHQLCLLQEDIPVINFNITGFRPKYSVTNAVLVVEPNRMEAFSFQLRGEWDLTENHLLTLTMGELVSTFDGFLNDRKSRFIYHFHDKQRRALNSKLGFTGVWEQITTEDGIPRLNFKYNREDDSEDVFELPAAIVIDKGRNQFMYTYDKENRSFSILLVGLLKINENFEITYVIDNQESREGDQMVKRSTFNLNAAYNSEQFTGDLDLLVLKENGEPSGHALALSGEYTGVVGETTVQVGFVFKQIRGRSTRKTTVGFHGGFTFKNGTAFYVFNANSVTKEVELTAGVDIDLKDGGNVSAKTCIQGKNGELKTISFLFGIEF